jgi:hypothetical protein
VHGNHGLADEELIGLGALFIATDDFAGCGQLEPFEVLSQRLLLTVYGDQSRQMLEAIDVATVIYVPQEL